MNVKVTTGLNLSTVILDKLNELTIPFEDCRGQAFDNGANMKGKHQGVQARLLKNKTKISKLVPMLMLKMSRLYREPKLIPKSKLSVLILL